MRIAKTKTTVRLLAGLLLALVAAASGALTSNESIAQEALRVCQTRELLLAQFDRKFGEAPVAVGVSGGALVELLTAEDGITWTLIVTSPKGISCLIAAGEGWRPLAPKESGPTV